MGDKQEKTAGSAKLKPGSPDDRTVGSALRSVYQQTVEEKIPGDLLDLLGKLS